MPSPPKVNPNPYRNRLRALYDFASADQTARGSLWYAEAHAFARELAKRTGLPLGTVVGVIAVLSPSVYWELNKRQARDLCEAHAAGLPLDSVPVSTYGRQVGKAFRLLTERPTSHVGVLKILGPRAFKTQAFFSNIMYPRTSRQVAIDQHIIDAAEMTGLWTNAAKWCYHLLAEAIRDIADERGTLPHHVQATVWIVWQELHADRARPADPDDDAPYLPF